MIFFTHAHSRERARRRAPRPARRAGAGPRAPRPARGPAGRRRARIGPAGRLVAFRHFQSSRTPPSASCRFTCVGGRRESRRV